MSKRTILKRKLRETLGRNGARLSKYGRGYAKTFEDLFESVESGEVSVKTITLLKCRKVKIDIYCEVEGVLWYLIEGDQEMPSGKRRGRSWKRSASEKIKRKEAARAAARRCLEEELGLRFTPETEPELYEYARYYASPRLSNSFPGTLVEGPRVAFVLMLHPSLFNPDGYWEIKNGRRRTHFGWKRAHEVWPLT